MKQRVRIILISLAVGLVAAFLVFLAGYLFWANFMKGNPIFKPYD